MGGTSRAFTGTVSYRIIAALGASFVAIAASLALVGGTGRPLAEMVIDLVLVGGPGVVLLLGGYRLPRTDLHPTVYSRILGWCLGGFALLLGIAGLRLVDPGVTIDDPAESVALATALGSVAGFAVGLYDARSLSRARTAERYSYALEQANDELETQRQRLESFAGMLAHELRNPLQIAQIYHEQSRQGDDAAAEQVERAHERIEEMIDILLVTARGTSGTTDVEPVAIADLATDAWDTVAADAREDDLVVDTERAVRADSVHIRYLFRNLFRNSIEHGGEAVTVRVGDLDEGFYIEDDGPGIPEDVRDDVVEAGFTTKSEGQGLGLTFAAQLAETYGWRWTIREGETGGTRVEFTDVERDSTADEVQRH